MKFVEILRYIYEATISFGLAALFFSAARHPEKNAVTRLLARYAEIRLVRGLEVPPRFRLIVFAYVCLGVGVFIVILAIVKLS